jgi:hypothetical protein
MTRTKTHSSENNYNNVNSLSLRQALEYCADVLKIQRDSEFYRSIAAEATDQTRVSLAMIKTHGNWITAMKLIADCNRISNYNINNNNNYAFSQSQLSDFLTLSARAIEGKIMSNVIFKMYSDIMENYENFSGSLKSNYARIIVDVISILHKGVDTNGSKVNSINVEKYYQLRRRQQGIMIEKERERPSRAKTTVGAIAILQNEILLSLYPKKDLVESLHQITNRERNKLQQSLTKLQDSDLKRISELCQNYNRLQYYSKLITKEGSQEQFKKEIETELGRKLNSTQLGRAINSIRRAQTYVENILDNKFIPDASHGINHVKHNIEYGYQLINLIECTRRKHKV